MVAPGQYNGDEEVLQLRDEFLDLAAHLAARYGVDGAAEKYVVRLLMDHVCEKCILDKLRQNSLGNGEIDRVWRNLHDYAVTLLMERLKNELAHAGIPISILSEADNTVGRYDVLLVVSRGSIQILNDDGAICVEAKTGFNISLSQAEKYMWNGVTVVIVRFATGDVIQLKASDWVSLLKSALRDRIEKARRILEGKAILVPGLDCKDCPQKECRFNKSVGSRTIRPRSLDELFENFRKNAYTAIEAAIKAIMEELNGILRSQTPYPQIMISQEAPYRG